MLTIRLQRTGRSGTAMFRVVVQDSRQTPTSAKVVTLLGSYNPHTKALAIDKDKAVYYLEHGAQPSPRTAGLLKADGVKLPSWVSASTSKQGKLRNPEKLRRNRPAETSAPVAAEPETPAGEATTAESEEPVTEASETPQTVEPAPTEESAE